MDKLTESKEILDDDQGIIFSNNNIEVLKICGNGDFYIKGKKIINDMKVYKGIVEFLRDSGYYM